MKGFIYSIICVFIFSFYASAENGINSERKFIDVVVQSQRDNMNAKNDMQRAGMRTTRDEAICGVIGDGTVFRWVGKIKYLGSLSLGKGALDIEIAPGITLKTTRDSFYNEESSIDVKSNLFKKVSIMNVGDNVLFSGRFIKKGYHSELCAEETSFSISNGLSDPEFAFKFTDVIKNEPTKEQIIKEQERVKSVAKAFTKACIFISNNDDKGAREAMNSISLPDGKKVDKISDEAYKGIKDYFIQHKDLNEESCKEGVDYLINNVMVSDN